MELSDNVKTSGDLARAQLESDLHSFMMSAGWHPISEGQLGQLWQSKSGMRVGVPYGINSQAPEWSSVLERLAHDARSSVQVIADAINGLWVDSFDFRASNDIYIDNTIPAKAGADLFQSVWRLLRSAATTSRGPKAQIAGNFSTVGDEAVENARFAHTRQGSYILPLIVPLQRPLNEDPSTFQLDSSGRASYHEPPARRATRTMLEALNAVSVGLVDPARDPKPSVVSDLVYAGVSREFINAVHDIVRHESVANLDVTAGWADMLPGPSGSPTKIVIPSESAPLLKRVAPMFKRSPEPKTETLTGPIYKMADREGDKFGIATMEVPRRGRVSQVDVFLDREQLAMAHEWFPAHKTVLIEGRVESTPSGLVMRKPIRFDLLGATMAFDGD